MLSLKANAWPRRRLFSKCARSASLLILLICMGELMHSSMVAAAEAPKPSANPSNTQQASATQSQIASRLAQIHSQQQQQHMKTMQVPPNTPSATTNRTTTTRPPTGSTGSPPGTTTNPSAGAGGAPRAVRPNGVFNTPPHRVGENRITPAAIEEQRRENERFAAERHQEFQNALRHSIATANLQAQHNQWRAQQQMQLMQMQMQLQVRQQQQAQVMRAMAARENLRKQQLMRAQRPMQNRQGMRTMGVMNTRRAMTQQRVPSKMIGMKQFSFMRRTQTMNVKPPMMRSQQVANRPVQQFQRMDARAQNTRATHMRPFQTRPSTATTSMRSTTGSANNAAAAPRMDARSRNPNTLQARPRPTQPNNSATGARPASNNAATSRPGRNATPSNTQAANGRQMNAQQFRPTQMRTFQTATTRTTQSMKPMAAMANSGMRQTSLFQIFPANVIPPDLVSRNRHLVEGTPVSSVGLNGRRIHPANPSPGNLNFHSSTGSPSMSVGNSIAIAGQPGSSGPLGPPSAPSVAFGSRSSAGSQHAAVFRAREQHVSEGGDRTQTTQSLRVNTPQPHQPSGQFAAPAIPLSARQFASGVFGLRQQQRLAMALQAQALGVNQVWTQAQPFFSAANRQGARGGATVQTFDSTSARPLPSPLLQGGRERTITAGGRELRFAWKFDPELTQITCALATELPGQSSADSGYIALGFARRRGTMVGADAVVGWMDPSTKEGKVTAFRLAGRTARAVNGNRLPDSYLTASSFDVVKSPDSERKWGLLKFTRPLIHDNDNGLDLIIVNPNQALHMLWAVGEETPATGDITYHSERGSLTIEQQHLLGNQAGDVNADRNSDEATSPGVSMHPSPSDTTTPHPSEEGRVNNDPGVQTIPEIGPVMRTVFAFYVPPIASLVLSELGWLVIVLCLPGIFMKVLFPTTIQSSAKGTDSDATTSTIQNIRQWIAKWLRKRIAVDMRNTLLHWQTVGGELLTAQFIVQKPEQDVGSSQRVGITPMSPAAGCDWKRLYLGVPTITPLVDVPSHQWEGRDKARQNLPQVDILTSPYLATPITDTETASSASSQRSKSKLSKKNRSSFAAASETKTFSVRGQPQSPLEDVALEDEHEIEVKRVDDVALSPPSTLSDRKSLEKSLTLSSKEANKSTCQIRLRRMIVDWITRSLGSTTWGHVLLAGLYVGLSALVYHIQYEQLMSPPAYFRDAVYNIVTMRTAAGHVARAESNSIRPYVPTSFHYLIIPGDDRGASMRRASAHVVLVMLPLLVWLTNSSSSILPWLARIGWLSLMKIHRLLGLLVLGWGSVHAMMSIGFDEDGVKTRITFSRITEIVAKHPEGGVAWLILFCQTMVASSKLIRSFLRPGVFTLLHLAGGIAWGTMVWFHAPHPHVAVALLLSLVPKSLELLARIMKTLATLCHKVQVPIDVEENSNVAPTRGGPTRTWHHYLESCSIYADGIMKLTLRSEEGMTNSAEYLKYLGSINSWTILRLPAIQALGGARTFSVMQLPLLDHSGKVATGLPADRITFIIKANKQWLSTTRKIYNSLSQLARESPLSPDEALSIMRTASGSSESSGSMLSALRMSGSFGEVLWSPAVGFTQSNNALSGSDGKAKNPRRQNKQRPQPSTTLSLVQQGSYSMGSEFVEAMESIPESSSETSFWCCGSRARKQTRSNALAVAGEIPSTGLHWSFKHSTKTLAAELQQPRRGGLLEPNEESADAERGIRTCAPLYSSRDAILFIAGGVGITAVLPVLLALRNEAEIQWQRAFDRMRNQDRIVTGSSSLLDEVLADKLPPRIMLLWCVREESLIRLLQPYLEYISSPPEGQRMTDSRPEQAQGMETSESKAAKASQGDRRLSENSSEYKSVQLTKNGRKLSIPVVTVAGLIKPKHHSQSTTVETKAIVPTRRSEGSSPNAPSPDDLTSLVWPITVAIHVHSSQPTTKIEAVSPKSRLILSRSSRRISIQSLIHNFLHLHWEMRSMMETQVTKPASDLRTPLILACGPSSLITAAYEAASEMNIECRSEEFEI